MGGWLRRMTRCEGGDELGVLQRYRVRGSRVQGFQSQMRRWCACGWQYAEGNLEVAIGRWQIKDSGKVNFLLPKVNRLGVSLRLGPVTANTQVEISMLLLQKPD